MDEDFIVAIAELKHKVESEKAKRLSMSEPLSKDALSKEAEDESTTEEFDYSQHQARREREAEEAARRAAQQEDQLSAELDDEEEEEEEEESASEEVPPSPADLAQAAVGVVVPASPRLLRKSSSQNLLQSSLGVMVPVEGSRFLSVGKYSTIRTRKHRQRVEPESELAALRTHLLSLLQAPEPAFLLYYPYLVSGRTFLQLIEEAYASAANATARLRLLNLLLKWLDNRNVRASESVLARIAKFVERVLLPSEDERWAHQLERLLARRRTEDAPLRLRAIAAALQGPVRRGGATERGEMTEEAVATWCTANLGLDAAATAELIAHLVADEWLQAGPPWRWSKKAEKVRPDRQQNRLSQEFFRWTVLTVPIDELVAQLSLIEHALLTELPLWELIEKRKQSAVPLQRITTWFNDTAGWVASEVLSCKSPAKMITRFTFIAQALLRIRNFNSMMAVVSGLNNPYVWRLKAVWSKVPKRVRQIFAELHSHLSGNYHLLREAQTAAVGKPSIPCFGKNLLSLTPSDNIQRPDPPGGNEVL